MKLIIGEKPSVAQTIAKVLGVRGRKDGYIEGNGYVISWCIGHLVAPAPPETYSEKYKHWDISDLPIIPEAWQYQVLSTTSKQFNLLKRLMSRKDITEVICATDAGREGELIFRLVYNEAKCKKPFKRLWISSLEEQSIRDGFRSLHNGHDFDNLYYAALARSKADWLIGMNATRLYSLKNYQTLNIGRVQTPVLNMIVEREKEISDFTPQTYYTVELNIGGFSAVSDRINEKVDAESVAMSCDGAVSAIITDVVTDKKSTAPPKLYDLTTLQREANRIYGYTAKQTLDVAQSLYEKKLITYPRTDSRYLTTDIQSAVPELFRIASDTLNITVDFTPDIKRVTDNEKVSDHHALIPTQTLGSADLSTISDEERNVLLLICKRLITSLAEPYRYDTVKITVECNGMDFHASGKTVTNIGWKQSETDKAEIADTAPTLPTLDNGSRFNNVSAQIKEHKTTPPKLYTEDTLLSAMENAVKSDNAERAGLGTPATRAGVIEHLVTRGFAARNGKNIVPTDKGRHLISHIPDSIKSADMTAEWEAELAKIANGKKTEAEFVCEVTNFVTALIETECGANG